MPGRNATGPDPKRRPVVEIADVLTRHPKRQFAPESAEAEDNRRLIAAAPELVEALRRLLAAFEADSQMMPNTPVIISWETNGAAIAEARAAIHKAEGK